MTTSEALEGGRRLIPRTIAAFPHYFRGSYGANYSRVSRWWEDQENLLSLGDNANLSPLIVTRSHVGKLSKQHVKTRGGRGWKTQLWVLWLFGRMHDEFDRLQKTGITGLHMDLSTRGKTIVPTDSVIHVSVEEGGDVRIEIEDGEFNWHTSDMESRTLTTSLQSQQASLKFSPKILLDMVLHILHTSDHVEFHNQSVDHTSVPTVEKITRSFTRRFMSKHNIVYRMQTGRLSWSPAKERHVRMLVSHHLGTLYHGFVSGEYNENYIENLDETHFVMNMDNGKTLGFQGDEHVKYVDVVSGGEAMTMVVRVTRSVHARIKTPMVIFTNANSSYHIQGLRDNIPGVTYRSSPKGWMNMASFAEYFSNPIAYQEDLYGHRKHVWVDNSSTHNSSPHLEQTLTAKNTQICYLPACSMSLAQPADQTIIQKIKDAWIRRWETKKTILIQGGEWQNDPQGRRGWSRKLNNPGKGFFLSLAAEAVRDVNQEQDFQGMNIARKSMIRCGLSLDTDGVWRHEQLFQEFQDIIAEFPNHFDGEQVPQVLFPEEE